MVGTPSTRRPVTRQNKPTKMLRRRIISTHIDETSSEDEETTKNSDKSSTVDLSTTKDGRKSVESSSLLPSFSADESGGRKSFYKSVLTPSRVRSTKGRPVVSGSIYRTPRIVEPALRKIQSPSKNKRIDERIRNKWKEDKKRLLNRTWKTAFLSSMTDFKFGSRNMRSAYEKTLKIRILDTYPSYHLTVRLRPSSFASQVVKGSPDAVVVLVESLIPSVEEGGGGKGGRGGGKGGRGGGEEGEQMVRVYEAVLVRSEKVQSGGRGTENWFPLLLHSGVCSVHRVFISWLQASFGCYVTRQGIPESSVMWVAGIWSYWKCANKEHKDAEDRSTSLHYRVQPSTFLSLDPPNDRQGAVTLKIEVGSNALREIWTSVQGGKPLKELTFEGISKFHSSFEDFVSSVTSLPRSFLHLAHIQTSCISLSSAGKLRLLCSSSYFSLLQHVIELFQQTCHFQNIDKEIEEMDDDGEDLEGWDEAEGLE